MKIHRIIYEGKWSLPRSNSAIIPINNVALMDVFYFPPLTSAEEFQTVSNTFEEFSASPLRQLMQIRADPPACVVIQQPSGECQAMCRHSRFTLPGCADAKYNFHSVNKRGGNAPVQRRAHANNNNNSGATRPQLAFHDFGLIRATDGCRGATIKHPECTDWH